MPRQGGSSFPGSAYNSHMNNAPAPDGPTLARCAHAYSRRGEYGRAVATFTGAIDLDPTDAELYFHRGNAHAAAGEYAEAVDDFTRAIALRPDYSAAFHNRATA